MKWLRSAIGLLYRTVGWLDRIFFILVILMLTVMTLSVGYEVFVRYVMNHPTIWVTEVCGYLLVGTSFLAAAYVARKDGHPGVDTFVLKLSPRTQLVINGFMVLFSVVFTAVLCWQGWLMAWNAHLRNWHSASVLRAPLLYPMVTITIGAGILTLELLVTYLYKVLQKSEQQ